MERNSLLVLHSLRLLGAFDCFFVLVHFFVAVAKGCPHARVLRLRESRLGEVMRRVIIKLIQLVDLAESVPSPEISIIDVNSSSVAFDRCIGVLQLKVLMPHQGPRT